MSQEEARRFLDNLSNDPELQRRFQIVTENVKMAKGFALSRGYRFSGSDLKDALAAYPAHPIIDELRKKWHIARVPRPPSLNH